MRNEEYKRRTLGGIVRIPIVAGGQRAIVELTWTGGHGVEMRWRERADRFAIVANAKPSSRKRNEVNKMKRERRWR